MPSFQVSKNVVSGRIQRPTAFLLLRHRPTWNRAVPYRRQYSTTPTVPLFWIMRYTQIPLPNRRQAASDETMEHELVDPSPAYTPASSARTLDDGRSMISQVPSISASFTLTPEHIKAHLRLLRAFQALKWRVQDPSSYPEVASRIPPRARSLSANDRWVWFLQLAVERYAYLPSN